MTSSEGTNKHKDKVDERPIRVDHGLMGERESEGSSVDGVSHEDISEFLGGSEGLQMHPFCVLLNFTTERGDAISHSVLVRKQLGTYALGKRYKNIFRLNQTDFLIEFEASDNPTLFAIKLGSIHTWLGIELHMDAHIGTTMTLKKVSRQCEEAQNIVDNAKIIPSKNMTSSSGKTEIEKISKEGCYEKREDPADKENAMLKVLESMSKKIEDLDRTAKENHTSTSIPNIRGQDFQTPSSGT